METRLDQVHFWVARNDMLIQKNIRQVDFKIYQLSIMISHIFLNHQPSPSDLHLGVYDQKVDSFASRQKSTKSTNHSRTLHRLIHRKNKTLSVEVSSIETQVKVPRKRKVIIKSWPVIHLSSWMKLCFEDKKYEGFFFLGGHRLENWDSAKAMFQKFWDRYSKIDPTAVPNHPSQTVPIYLHGDEGRGLGKRPLLVISFQPLMGWGGGECVPSTKYLCQI